ncbi:MAG TPA: lactate racemase domain-containing protein [Actinomycetota bacterium]|nr:lactate racemase domain-containing protein [Actinomycetota bacterium]
MRTELVSGNETISVELPDDTVFPSAGITVPFPVCEDLEGEVARALREPLDSAPLSDLARGARRVTVAFDDPTVQMYAPLWPVAIRALLAELEAAGVDARQVDLLCANALHRKWTHDELAKLIGEDLVTAFADRLTCHDAEDPEHLVDLGTTPGGLHVELNKACVDSDLVVYVNCSTVRGFSGGWKSICVGLSTYRSIRHHHNPDDMSMSLHRNRMHAMLDEMGALVTDRLGSHRFFKLETVEANPLQVSRVFGGTVDACRQAAVELRKAHQPARRDLIDDPADVVVYGVPDWSPYAAFAYTNRLLTLVSTGLGYLGGVIEAFGAPGCTAVLATPCPDRWDDHHHPSYRDVWENVLPVTRDPYQIEREHSEAYAARPEYVDAYRHHNAFHGSHAVMATFPLKRLRHAGRVVVAGATDPSLPRHVGFDATETVEEAVSDALSAHGPGARVACVRYPQAWNRA